MKKGPGICPREMCLPSTNQGICPRRHGGFRRKQACLGRSGNVWVEACIAVGGLGCRGGAGGGGGAEPTLCNRSRIEFGIGESLLSSAEEVGRVATMASTIASWVVTVSSCFVKDASALSEKQRKEMRKDSPSDKS